MPYCNLDDLTGRYGAQELIQVTDKATPPSGAVDERTITRACSDASAVVDSYARSRYVTPLAAANIAIVLPYVCAIARWFLHDDGHAEHIEHGYKDAIAWLTALSKGIVALPDLTAPANGTASVFGVAVKAPAQVFGDAFARAIDYAPQHWPRSITGLCQ